MAAPTMIQLTGNMIPFASLELLPIRVSTILLMSITAELLISMLFNMPADVPGSVQVPVFCLIEVSPDCLLLATTFDPVLLVISPVVLVMAPVLLVAPPVVLTRVVRLEVAPPVVLVIRSMVPKLLELILVPTALFETDRL